MNNNPKNIYDNICEYSELIKKFAQENLAHMADEAHTVALKMALNKYKTMDSEKFEDWLMQQIEMRDAELKEAVEKDEIQHR